MIFLDCEFDGFGGSLISMAMISTHNEEEFYEVVDYPDHPKLGMPNDWVRENVIPKLGKKPIPHLEFRDKVHVYLQKHVGEMIVADSPADFKYLLDQLEWMTDDNKYRYLNLEIKMQFTPSGEYKSKIPHNALEDARALRKWYLDTLKSYGTTQVGLLGEKIPRKAG